MKLAIVILAMTLSPGCAVYQGYKAAAADYAGKVAGTVLLDAEYVLCKAAPVGAVEARYNTPELTRARRTICDRPVLVK